MNTQTLRYYESRGLLPDPGRTAAGCGPDAVRIVRFVKRAQELGFTLTEIETLLDTEKITELDSKITHLRAMRASLARLADTCTCPRADRDCPLLHSLDPTFDTTEATGKDTVATVAAVNREED